jgi:hypothetical protein
LGWGLSACGFTTSKLTIPVVVCEALAKSELTEGTTYKRTAAVLDGSVKLNYELKYKKDREIPQSLECKFQRSPDQADFIFFQSKGCELPEKADRSDPGYNLCEQLLAAMARLRIFNNEPLPVSAFILSQQAAHGSSKGSLDA